MKRKTRRDDNNFPVAFITTVDAADKIVPGLTDLDRVRLCYRARLCGVCGEQLLEGEEIAFIGGEKENLKSRWFHDPAMHPECARYSFRVCPFLAEPGYVGSISGDTRPEMMMLYFTTGYRVPWWRRIINWYAPMAKADPPLRIERWPDKNGPS